LPARALFASADAFDGVEDSLARLRANRAAQQFPEQPDVVSKRLVRVDSRGVFTTPHD
jgi:hypothetical protein